MSPSRLSVSLFFVLLLAADYVRAEMVKAFIASDEYVKRFGQ